ncbi:MAG: preprotein translocase subunit SecG [Lachnospiraceae bacterium]|nr:preprotein translocase subunit SecG [Lachnospiraceae bacterium]
MVLDIILTVFFVLVSIALVVLVLLQEGKSAGLGAISGAAETYWGKNKGRSMEGFLEKATKYLVIAFFLIAILMNMFA